MGDMSEFKLKTRIIILCVSAAGREVKHANELALAPVVKTVWTTSCTANWAN